MKISSTVLRGAVGKGAYLRHLAGCLPATNDGRKLALDQRLINPFLPDDPKSKVNACVQKVFENWEKSKNVRGTQIIFSDLSTPKEDGSFNIYDDIKKKLIAKGIPKEEIAFVHDAKTEKQKDNLFSKVCDGKVRVLLGSTNKLGTGTNVQQRLVGTIDLDCP